MVFASGILRSRIIVMASVAVLSYSNGLLGQNSGARNPNSTAWNQLGEESLDGAAADLLRLSMGGDFAPILNYNTYGWQGQFEYMTNNYIGFTGLAHIPLANRNPDWFRLPLALGINIHTRPKSVIDWYLGGSAGFHILRYKGERTQTEPLIELHSGITFYFWGAFFAQWEGGYLMSNYLGDTERRRIHYPRAGMQLGIYF